MANEYHEYPPITLIELRGEGQDLVVSVEFADRPGEYVEVIREYVPSATGEPHPIGHAIHPAGLAAKASDR